MINGNIERIIVLNCKDEFDFILEFCGKDKSENEIELSDIDFNELYVKGYIKESIYSKFRDIDISKIFARR